MAASKRATKVIWDKADEALEALSRRRVYLTPCPLTPNDIFEMTVNPEHRQLSRDAVSVLGCVPTSSYAFSELSEFGIKKDAVVHINIASRHDRTFVIPKDKAYPTYASLDQMEKLVRWIATHVDHYTAFRHVEQLMIALKDGYTANEALYLWSPLRMLVAMVDNDFAENLPQYSTPSRLRAVSPGLRGLLKPTMHTITKAMLLPEPEIPFPCNSGLVKMSLPSESVKYLALV